MTRFSSETRGGCAILRRLQDRGAPAGAAPLRFAVLASLGHRPEPSVARAFAGTSPAAAHSLLRLGTGPSLSSLSLSCFARKTRACRPWHARLPGKGSTGPFAMLRFTHGLGVRRDERPPDCCLSPAHPPDCCLAPAHPPDTRLIPAHPLAPRQVCGAPRAGPFGRENCHGHLSFRGLTPAGDGLRNKCSSCFHRGRLEKHC